jgi:hypothetical protein
MRTQRRTIQLPNFEACSVVLIAFAALINAPAARAQVGFGPGPTASEPAKSTATKVVTPPKAAASSPKPSASGTKSSSDAKR